MLSILKKGAFLLSLYLIFVLPSPALTAPHTDSSPLLSSPEKNLTVFKTTASTTKYIPPYPYTGDVLNVTKCYCEDSNAATLRQLPMPDFRWGHYFHFSYYNYHLRQLYTIAWSCHTRHQYRDNLPTCWDARKTHHEGKQFPDGNYFSYKVGFDGIWGDGRDDHYYFNGQKRGLPPTRGDGKGNGTVRFEPRVCEGLCRERVEGMVVARDGDGEGEGEWVRTWWGPQGNVVRVRSEVTSYTDTDDMCDKCK